MRKRQYLYLMVIWGMAFSILATAAWAENILLLEDGTAVTYSGESVHVGESCIELFNPAHLIRVDGLDEKVDQIFAVLQPPEALLLAVYAEEETWLIFQKSVNGEGPLSTLDFFAFIATPNDVRALNRSIQDFADFRSTMRERILRDGGVIEEDSAEYIIYRLKLNNDSGENKEQLSSAVLKNGAIVFLSTVINEQNKYRHQFESTALSWRDAYLGHK